MNKLCTCDPQFKAHAIQCIGDILLAMDVQIGTQFGLNQSYRVSIEKNPNEEYRITTEFNAGEEFKRGSLNPVAKLHHVKKTYESIMKLKEVGIVGNVNFQFIHG